MLGFGSVCVEYGYYCGPAHAGGGRAMLAVGSCMVVTLTVGFITRERMREGEVMLDNAYFLGTVYLAGALMAPFGALCWNTHVHGHGYDDGRHFCGSGPHQDNGFVIVIAAVACVVFCMVALWWTEQDDSARQGVFKPLQHDELLTEFICRTEVADQYGQLSCSVSLAAMPDGSSSSADFRWFSLLEHWHRCTAGL